MWSVLHSKIIQNNHSHSLSAGVTWELHQGNIPLPQDWLIQEEFYLWFGAVILAPYLLRCRKPPFYGCISPGTGTCIHHGLGFLMSRTQTYLIAIIIGVQLFLWTMFGSKATTHKFSGRDAVVTPPLPRTGPIMLWIIFLKIMFFAMTLFSALVHNCNVWLGTMTYLLQSYIFSATCMTVDR